MITLAIITWLTFVVASAVAGQVIKNKEARKTNRRYVDVVDDTFKGISNLIGLVMNKVDGVDKRLSVWEQKDRLNVPKEGVTRCYAVILQRGAETRLFVQQAQTFEEILAICTMEFGAGWSVVSSAHVEVYEKQTPNLNPVLAAKIDSKIESKQVGSFIKSLEYSRDKFAATPSQKKAVDAIITNIKKLYGRSHSGTA